MTFQRQFCKIFTFLMIKLLQLHLFFVFLQRNKAKHKYASMKRLFLALVMTSLVSVASATDYNYLTLENADGNAVSLSVSGLTLTFSNGNLVANDGTVLPLSSLTKMYFTETSGISTISTMGDGPSGIYTLSGVLVSTHSLDASISSLPKGIYIVKQASGHTKKIQVR